MKTIFFSLLVLFSAQLCVGQVQVGKIDYQGHAQSAAIIEYPYNPDVVTAAVKDYISKKGSRAGQSKGFITFKNVMLAQTGPANSDVYIKVDPKSRKEKDVSVVSMIVTKQNENISARGEDDTYGMEEAKVFLDQMAPSLESYQLEVQIKDQEELTKKADKKYQGLINDGVDLEKRKKSIEDKITENKLDQEKQRAEQAKQKAALDALVSQRKG